MAWAHARAASTLPEGLFRACAPGQPRVGLVTLPGWVGVGEPSCRLGGLYAKNVTICPTQACTIPHAVRLWRPHETVLPRRLTCIPCRPMPSRSFFLPESRGRRRDLALCSCSMGCVMGCGATCGALPPEGAPGTVRARKPGIALIGAHRTFCISWHLSNPKTGEG